MEPIKRAFFVLIIAVSILAIPCGAVFARGDFQGEKKYAPDRKAEILHLKLNVTPDFNKRTVAGVVTFKLKPIGKALDELRLDAIDIAVSELKCSVPIAGYQVTDKEIVVTFEKALPVHEECELTISYSAKPKMGLYFRVPSNGYSETDMHIYSQGEMIEARHWFPCYDYPNSKFTSEVICHVPESMTVLSNGKQVSSKKDENGLLEVRWIQDKPHVNYLIAMVAGKFSKLEDSSGDVPLSFYYLPSDAEEAQQAFAPTKPAIEFFEKEIGIKYPWSKYAQAVVHEFGYTGMENTSLTTLSDFPLYAKDTENIFAYGGTYTPQDSYLLEPLVVHELAHQWFGDLVSFKDWSHSWLSEGFASYYACLFAAHQHGRDDMLYTLYEDREKVISKADPRPIVNRTYYHPYEQFDDRAYSKATWVLHMLRDQLGEDLFRRCIKTYLERHQYQSVVTQDLIAVVEELSGRSFDRFFDQWVYNSGLPELSIYYSWDEQSKQVKISLMQTQSPIPEGDRSTSMGYSTPYAAHRSWAMGPQVQSEQPKAPVFQFPLTLRFKTSAAVIDKQIEVKEKEEDFYIPLHKAPDSVLIDPNMALLAKINFRTPVRMLRDQLFDKDDVVARMNAAEQLSSRDDEKNISDLKKCLNSDSSFAVRIIAAGSLRKIHNEDALQALIDSLVQPDARVRDAVVRNIGKFFHPRAYEVLISVIKSEKNPAIVATAIGGISTYHKPEVHDLLLKYLDSDSYHNRTADAAIAAMEEQDDPAYVPSLCQTLKNKKAAFTSYGFSNALHTLAHISRNEKSRDEVRNFIVSFLNDKKDRIRIGAIRALGALEDPEAIAILETFTTASQDAPEHAPAKQAIAKLRSVNKPHDNLKDLREEVLELKTSQRQMKKEVDELKKELQAAKKYNQNQKREAEGSTSSRSTKDRQAGSKHK